jgi:hypothetical protein
MIGISQEKDGLQKFQFSRVDYARQTPFTGIRGASLVSSL